MGAINRVLKKYNIIKESLSLLLIILQTLNKMASDWIAKGNTKMGKQVYKTSGIDVATAQGGPS